ncbi:hypothetical protein CRUP_013927, partial [Coryphaenoides rupestris]
RREALLGSLAGRAPGLRPDSGAPGAGGVRGGGAAGATSTASSPVARPSSIHRGLPWFHGGVSRREAQRLVEEQGLVDGRLYYSMDDGVTVFADLLQLVEFHEINRGILP